MKPVTFLGLMMISFSSCFQQYYKTNTTSKIDSVQIQKLETENKTFIVHAQGDVFLLRNAKLMDGALYGGRETLNPKYDKYLDPEVNGSNRYPKKEKAIALSEVHIYTNDSVGGNGPVNLAVSQIFRIDVYNQDKSATRGSTGLSIAGIVVPVVGIIVVAAVSVSHIEFESFNLDMH